MLGVTPAVVGSLQATEVLKILLETGKLLTGRLLTYDGWPSAVSPSDPLITHNIERNLNSWPI